MADKPSVIGMEGKRNAAVWTRNRFSAGPAADKGMIPTPVQKKNRLLLSIQIFAERLTQAPAQNRRISFLQFPIDNAAKIQTYRYIPVPRP